MIESNHSHSPRETEEFGEKFARPLRGGEIVGLVGELGSGKTCFVRGMAKGFGLLPTVVLSPTFTLVHEYPIQPGRPGLVHIDLYRINEFQELQTLGIEDYLRPDRVVVIEWADKLTFLNQAFPCWKNMISIHFTLRENDERDVKIL